MFKRLVPVFALAALATALAVPAASAAQPTMTTVPFSGAVTFPVGTLCDFNYQIAFSGTDQVTTFSDGQYRVHREVALVHTNLDTTYALTERDAINFTYAVDGTLKVVGQAWHARDANGMLVIHQAGLTIYSDPSGFDNGSNVIKFTPGLTTSFAAVICPALGGSPA